MTLPGMRIKQLKRFADERGFFTEIMRTDWKELFEGDDIAQTNLSITYPGIIRAWHKHERGQTDYFLVIRGAIKICAFDESANELDEVFSTGENPQIVRVPGNYWHGFKALGQEPAILVYFVNKLYDHDKPDELRRPWDDVTIAPVLVNGKKDDPRCSKPWDWLEPPYR